ncbi:MAG: GTP pyrophosphokinase family protein [Clostridiales Family XIII bacterium]|jgi:putative GTP pyrophosphokinase|nr:GTP pyrophosphokinase family protein [Clostridiales Family XIII bacterium]
MQTQEKVFYGEYFPALKAAESAFVQILKTLAKTYKDAKMRFPIEHYKVRIKSAESAKEKLARLNHPQTIEAAKQHLSDLVGARIVCQFVCDIYALEQALRGIKNVELVQVKDYIKTPKPNGYRSLHIIMKLPVQNLDMLSTVFVEVQIRTIAMDFWASLEHELKYKKDIPHTDLMVDELKRCADEITSTDLSMQTIFEWLQHAPNSMESTMIGAEAVS